MSHDQHMHTPESHEAPDAWHSHTAGEQPHDAHAEKVDVPQVIAFGIAGFMLIVVAIVATVIYFNWYSTGMMIRKVEQGDLYDPKIARVDQPVSEYRKRLEAEQDDTGWANPDKNLARLPIDKAKKKVADALANSK